MAFNSKLRNLRKISKVKFPGAVCPIGNNVSHTPIFAREVLDILRPKGGQVFVDATHGTGGHTRLILDKQKHARVFAFDIDDNSIELGKKLGKLYKIDSLHASVFSIFGFIQTFHQIGGPPTNNKRRPDFMERLPPIWVPPGYREIRLGGHDKYEGMAGGQLTIWVLCLGAKAITAKKTQKWLSEKLEDFGEM
ncbi:unnamed protein product [Lepeophtheirus salmonis]|uniref:(salmon louse) hypothetical protein n=1 Tax=Lepeophtheirus salmonis TaxID=72036 RepID=A0A7R8H883_LEPSM|nr:unnamed protein product [Lepeophtheirus salmonis]CAF2935426.1 unnamed protein product [Lepeophtheirus salmonis]